MHLDTLFDTGSAPGALVIPQQVRGGFVLREGYSPFVPPFGEVWEEFDVVQLEPGGGLHRLEHVQGRDVFVLREECPCKVFARGRLGRGRFGLWVRLGGPEASFAGQVVEDGFAASAIHGEEIRFAAQAGSRHLVIVVDHDRLQRLALQSGVGEGVMRMIRDGCAGRLLRVRRQATQPLERLLDEQVDGRPGMEIEAFDRVVYGAALALIEPGQPPSAGPSSTEALFRRALDLADADHGMPKISDLSKALHVSPRTLHKAFQLAAGIGPAGFFQKRQLHRARMRLLGADVPQSKIRAIAKELGITELGRFAVRYREMFGESPSATLRRVSGRA